MDTSNEGFSFLPSWSDDLDPAVRRAGAGTHIDFSGVYLPRNEPATPPALRSRAATGVLTLAALSVAALWLLMRER